MWFFQNFFVFFTRRVIVCSAHNFLFVLEGDGTLFGSKPKEKLSVLSYCSKFGRKRILFLRKKNSLSNFVRKKKTVLINSIFFIFCLMFSIMHHKVARYHTTFRVTVGWNQSNVHNIIYYLRIIIYKHIYIRGIANTFLIKIANF